MNGNGDPEKMKNRDMLHSMYISWFGVVGTDDKGAIHVLRQLDEKFDSLESRVTTNTAWRKILIAGFSILITLLCALIGVTVVG